ncbi:MAG: shikimate kinase [Bacteroidota bacterium]
MRIYLIGFMTAGKTTLGRAFTEQSGWTFVDIDEALIEREGKSIAEIFAEDGEEHFRLVEREALEATASQYREKVVFATGGGLPCFYDNIERINQLGTSVYLQLPAEELLRRIRKDRADRPLVRDKTAEELESFVRNLLAKRQAFYQQAHHTLTQSQQTKEALEALFD